MKHQIHHIFKKGKHENAPEKERQEMLSLFHQPENEFELKQELLEDLSDEKISATALPDLNKLFSGIWTKIEKTGKRNSAKIRHLNTLLKIAAAIVVGLFIGIYIDSEKTVPAEPVYYTAHSPKGSVSRMSLPDGSDIFLNAGSEIKYSIEGRDGTREVFLTGEAWFNVAKNEEKPFVVYTSTYNIQVTGTQFNVKAYESDDKIITTLEEGQVKIVASENLQIAEEIVLKPGEQLVLDKKQKEIAVKTVNTKWFTSWKDNRLIFVNMNFKDLVVLLERKYGVNIEVKNEDILDLHFDGTIKNESILEILEIIKKTLPINYEIVGQKVEITNNKN